VRGFEDRPEAALSSTSMRSFPVHSPRGSRLGVVAAAAVAIALLACADAARAQSIAVKRLFAPASDVAAGTVVLPTPREAASASQAAILFAPRDEAMRFEFSTGTGSLRLAPLGPDAISWNLEITDPGRAQAVPLVGEAVDPRIGASRLAARTTERIAGQDAFGSPEPTRMLEFAIRAGEHAVTATLPRHVAENTDGTDGAGTTTALLVDDDGEAALLAYPSRWDVAAGETLELVVEARMPVSAAAPLASASLADRTRAGRTLGLAIRRATVRWADGRTSDAHDMRKAGAKVADGSIALRFAGARAGDAVVQIEADAIASDGTRWTRSIATVVPVASTRIALAGAPRVETALGTAFEGAWTDLVLSISTSEPVVFAATELWARGSRGERCLGWIGGIAEVVRDARGDATVRIGCARARIAVAPGESLVCRNLRVHARDGFAPRLLVDAVATDTRDAAEPQVDAQADTGANPHADFGIPGIATVPFVTRRSFIPGPGSHALVLTHGYCADENPWPLAQFSPDAWPYLDANANRSHDAFALDVAADAAQFKSYGIVGHSQGGCAALHLYAFYWSGLDWTGPGRLIQAVGSPFEGTPIAGNLAALGEVFGVQCGSNYDLTTAGAAAWLSAIPTAARAKVYTHTTTFTNVPFVYDYCNIFVDPFLSDPEDGVVEHAAGHFPGANDMGLRSGWCHVSGMRDPAQTNDGNRNATLNAEGAR